MVLDVYARRRRARRRLRTDELLQVDSYVARVVAGKWVTYRFRAAQKALELRIVHLSEPVQRFMKYHRNVEVSRALIIETDRSWFEEAPEWLCRILAACHHGEVAPTGVVAVLKVALHGASVAAASRRSKLRS